MKRIRINLQDVIKAIALDSNGRVLSSLCQTGFSNILGVIAALNKSIPECSRKTIIYNVFNENQNVQNVYKRVAQ